MWHRFSTGVLPDPLPGAVGVEVGGFAGSANGQGGSGEVWLGGLAAFESEIVAPSRAGEGGLESSVVVQVEVYVVVEVEDAAADVQRAVDVGLRRKATLEMPCVLQTHVFDSKPRCVIQGRSISRAAMNRFASFPGGGRALLGRSPTETNVAHFADAGIRVGN